METKNITFTSQLVAQMQNDVLNVTAAGQALSECGESYRQLAEVKYSLEDNVRQNFIDPLLHLQSKDLREVNVRVRFLYICITSGFVCLHDLLRVSVNCEATAIDHMKL